MSTVRQLLDTNIDLENEESVLLDDDRLHDLIDRKLEEIQDELYSDCKRYSQEEVDEALEKIFLRAEQIV